MAKDNKSCALGDKVQPAWLDNKSCALCDKAGHHVWKSQASDESLAKNDDLKPRERFVLWRKKYPLGGAIMTLSARARHFTTFCQGGAILTQPRDRSECLFISTEHN